MNNVRVNTNFIDRYREDPVKVMRNAVKDPMYYADDEAAIISSHDVYVNSAYECTLGETDMKKVVDRTVRGGATYFNLILPTGEKFRLDIGMVRVNNPIILIRSVAPSTRAFIAEFTKMLKCPEYIPNLNVANKMVHDYNGTNWIVVSSSKAPYAVVETSA